MNAQTIEKHSVCPLDCSDTCSLTAHVTDGKLSKVRGSKKNPFTKGVICQKVHKYYPDFLHGKKRLTQPLKRVGEKGSGQFEEIDWDEAIELCYQGMQKSIDQYGPESVMPFNYSGPHGQLAGGSMDRRFFYKLGASQLHRSPLCAGVSTIAYNSMFGQQIAMPMEQTEHSDLIIIWGSNTTSVNLHLMKYINNARKKGGKLVVIDPQRTKISRIADLYIQIDPTSDAFFALAMAAEFERLGLVQHDKIKDRVVGLDEYLLLAKKHKRDDITKICGCSDDDIYAFIDLFKTSKRASMITGVGLERSRNGGSAIRSAMALLVLTGHFGAVGQGVMGQYGMAFNKATDQLQRPDLLENETRTINILDVPDVLLGNDNGIPLKAIFIYNHNPMVMNPDQTKLRKALTQDDVFVIGCDIVMTDSMKLADVILPACSHFEHKDIFASYGHTYIQKADAVINPVGNALPNTEIFRRLGQRFGFNETAFTDSDDDLMAQAFHIEQSKTLESGDFIATHNLQQTWLNDNEALDIDRNIYFYDEALEKDYGYGLPKYVDLDNTAAFRLISPASPKRTNSTFGGHEDSLDTQIVDINSDDAKQLGIASGQLVQLKNHKGKVTLKAAVGDTVPKGVVCTFKGAWIESSTTDMTINALIDNHSRTDVGDGAAYYDTFVDIEKVV